jgi:5-methylthioadenosine/S-adenosylhomocysteine deaminase
MVTLIQGGYVIGNDGKEHRLIMDGVVVFEDDKIVHVGKSYSGSVDERIDAKGKIVSPGFVNTHCHSFGPLGIGFGCDLSIDRDFRNAFGNPNLVNLPTKKEIKPPKDSNREYQIGSTRPPSDKNYQIGSKWCLCCFLKSGMTTIAGYGIGRESDVELYGELGARAYLGPFFSGAVYYAGDNGEACQKDWNEEMFRQSLEKAIAFIKKHDGKYDGRIKGTLFPHEEAVLTNSQLKEIRKVADELNCGVQLHMSARHFDFVECVQKYKNTPVGRLNDLGVLGPDFIAAHCYEISGHSSSNYPGDDDLKILADNGVSIAHCPRTYARKGSAMESFQKYMDYGVNLTIGTDNWPYDIISEMRDASVVSKLMDKDRRSASSLSVYNAVTINAAKALRRDDLGRLAKGAKADIIIIDVKNFRWPPINDPIKCLVHAGTMDDVETVIIDGKKVVEGKKIIGVDEMALMEDLRTAMEEEHAKVPKWDYLGRTKWEMMPMSLKLME